VHLHPRRRSPIGRFFGGRGAWPSPLARRFIGFPPSSCLPRGAIDEQRPRHRWRAPMSASFACVTALSASVSACRAGVSTRTAQPPHRALAAQNPQRCLPRRPSRGNRLSVSHGDAENPRRGSADDRVRRGMRTIVRRSRRARRGAARSPRSARPRLTGRRRGTMKADSPAAGAPSPSTGCGRKVT